MYFGYLIGLNVLGNVPKGWEFGETVKSSVLQVVEAIDALSLPGECGRGRCCLLLPPQKVVKLEIVGRLATQTL